MYFCAKTKKIFLKLLSLYFSGALFVSFDDGGELIGTNWLDMAI